MLRLRTLAIPAALASLASAGALLLVWLVDLPFAVQHSLFMALIFISAASAWALLAGQGGQFSLGHAALFGLPAYGAYLLTSRLDWVPLLALGLSVLLVSAVGTALVAPTLKLAGPYFALVTLAVAEIARFVVNAARETTGGEDGRLLQPEGAGFFYLNPSDKSTFLVWAAVLAAATLFLTWMIIRSTVGVHLRALRDDEMVARSTGVHPRGARLLVFFLSGVICGVAGGVLAYSSGIVASEFLLSVHVSISILVFAVVGGIRSLLGPALGALVLMSADQYLRIKYGATIPNIYPIGYTAIFCLALFFAPAGVVPLASRLLDRSEGEAEDTVSWGYSKRQVLDGATTDAQEASMDLDAFDELLEQMSSLRVRENLSLSEPKKNGPILSARNLKKSFGAVKATDGLSLEVLIGERIGIWGPNGSGKTTLLNLFAGQLFPDEGEIWLSGKEVTGKAPEKRALLGLSRTYQQARLYDAQSAVHNLFAALSISIEKNPLWVGDRRVMERLALLALRAVGLPERTHRALAGSLSTGQRKRLELARCLVGVPPRVFMLDEPTAGIDKAGVPQMAALLRAVQHATGSGFVVVDHDLDFVREMSDRVVCLVSGDIVASIPAQDERFDQRISRVLEGDYVTE